MKNKFKDLPDKFYDALKGAIISDKCFLFTQFVIKLLTKNYEECIKI